MKNAKLKLIVESLESKSTSRWSKTDLFHRAAECSNLHDIEANVNFMIQLKERPLNREN
jgi:hypothetical protein